MSMMAFLLSLFVAFQPMRYPAVSGMFYPSDPKALRDLVDTLIAKANPPKIEDNLLVLIVPHAGYRYSGHVAANAFKLLENRDIDLVVLLGPSHRYPLRGISVAPFASYRTPLGTIEVDTALASKLIESGVADSVKNAHVSEHSLEVELPFLQRVLKKDFKILPVLVGYARPEKYRDFAQKLVELIRGRKAIVIVSTDLSHYRPYDECVRIDSVSISAILSMDPVELYNGYFEKRYELCGIFATVTGLFVAHELNASGIKLLKYANSAYVTKDSSRVVGYSAIAIYRKELLNEDERMFLLKVARDAIKARLEGKDPPNYKVTDPKLLERRGVFVTIMKNGMLRGCIGRHISDRPLWRTVQDMAIAAAFHDPRFPPLRADEFDDIKIKISVYTSEPHPIPSYKDYIPGMHGIILVKNGHQATYLPEVPIEQCWTREETLSHLSVKAGLPPDAWKSGCSFYVYTTYRFSE